MANPAPAHGTARGTVTRIDAHGWAWVSIPAFGHRQEFGPCEMVVLPGGPPVAGTRVLLAQVTSGDFVVIGVLPTPTPTTRPA
jgi:hypothetical protein